MTGCRPASRRTPTGSSARWTPTTGEKAFLQPYDDGRRGAFTAFDQVAGDTRDPVALRLLYAERQAAVHWLYAYAIPIVNAGVADDEPRATRGKEMFDDVRVANARVGAALRAEGAAVERADRLDARLAQLFTVTLPGATAGVPDEAAEPVAGNRPG